MADRNTISQVVESLFEDWIDKNINVHPLAVENMRLLEADAIALLKQEAKNGYWINPISQDCHCSECGEQPVHEPGESVPLYDFCPYCGAKMEVKWDE